MPPKASNKRKANLGTLGAVVPMRGGKKEEPKKDGGKKEDPKKQGGKKDVPTKRQGQKGGCGCSEMLVHP